MSKSDSDHRSLNVVIVSAVFPPEYTFSAKTSADIAEELARQGNQVNVLAPYPNRPGGELFPGYKRALYKRNYMPRGYDVVHCFSTLAPKSRMLPRFLENLSFGLTSGCRLLILKRIDLIYSNTWAIFASAIIAAVARLRGIPLIVSVQDVYPESLISQGRGSKQNLAIRLMRMIDRWIANTAAGVITASERIRELYARDRGVPPSHIHVVHNWGERGAIDTSDGAEFRAVKRIPHDAFLAVYGGNIGPASGVEALIESFARLQRRPCYLMIAGSGSRLEACRRRAAELGCEHVIFHSPWNSDETDAVLGAADVLLLPTAGRQSLVSMPSKLISYMLAGKPVIAQVLEESETAAMVRSADAGWVIQPDSPALLATLLSEIGEIDPEQLRLRGANGRKFALANLCRESNLPRVIDVLRGAARPEGMPPP
jgi:colanic acid biosynthesis glycosyl transferase WcaI